MKQSSRRSYLVSEINRLSNEGVAISKIAKMLNIDYKLAKRLKTISE